jgi:hypothetical protein
MSPLLFSTVDDMLAILIATSKEEEVGGWEVFQLL